MNRGFALAIGAGCVLIIGLIALVAVVFLWIPFRAVRDTAVEAAATPRPVFQRVGTALPPAPTFTPAPPSIATANTVSAGTNGANNSNALMAPSNLLAGRYEQLSPGVVNIDVLVESVEGSGQGAGSGFILDVEGHIVTNNHVVAGATDIVVNFANGLQAEAKILGVDDDSDLAVIKVEQMPEDAHPLPLGDSDLVRVGDWAIAIGNPFGLGGSMTLGIISALGRTIPSGVAQFSIPQAIQTDAAINPGNSGGPLLNLDGEVIGVNAQIRTGGANANTGVGFAIPANVVRHVVPSLIANGSFQWPYLGVGGADLNLSIARANNLDIQQGAYISSVEPDGPAAQAGLRGATALSQSAVGGDVVIEADGQPIATFDDLLNYVAFKTPGDQVTLTVLREGQPQQFTVTLGSRPDLDVQSP